MQGTTIKPNVEAFFDEATFTASYVVSDPTTGSAAIVDPVLDFDPASGRTSTASADQLLEYLRAHELDVQILLDTHVHADHLTATHYLREQTGAKSAIQIGDLQAHAMHTPGHTPICMVYVIGDAAFVGDTLFMPDSGSARCDFPGGDARILYRSIQKIFALPGETRLFICHDYKAPGREHYAWETTVAAQRAQNIHVHDGVTEDEFVAVREARDATLSMPRLILPSVQVNMRAGEMPPCEDDGVSYLKLPVNAL